MPEHDASDGPYSFSGVQEHLLRLREVYLVIKDDKLVGLTDDEIANRSDGAFSRQQINHMSVGRSENPAASRLVGLSNAFEISPMFWFSEKARRRILRDLDDRLEGLRNELLSRRPTPSQRARDRRK